MRCNSVPPLQNGKAPKPTDKNVYLDMVPAFEVYVGTYGGFSDEDKIVTEVGTIIVSELGLFTLVQSNGNAASRAPLFRCEQSLAGLCDLSLG